MRGIPTRKVGYCLGNAEWTEVVLNQTECEAHIVNSKGSVSVKAHGIQVEQVLATGGFTSLSHRSISVSWQCLTADVLNNEFHFLQHVLYSVQECCRKRNVLIHRTSFAHLTKG